MECFIHQGEHCVPEVMEVHHKTPRAYGGSDDPNNLVNLCALCHTCCHAAALKLYSNKAGQAKDMVVRYLPNQPARVERMWRLVQTVAKARKQHVRSAVVPEAGVEANHQSIVKMQLELPDWLHHRYKALSAGQGLNRYIMKVLENHAMVAISKPGATAAELFGTGSSTGTPTQDPRPLQLLDLTGKSITST